MLKTSLSKAVSITFPYSDHLLCFRMKSSRIWGSRMSTSRDSSNRLGEKLSQPRCSMPLTQWANSTSSRGTHALSTEIQCTPLKSLTTSFLAVRMAKPIPSCLNWTCRSPCLIQGRTSHRCTTSMALKTLFALLSITRWLRDSTSLAHPDQRKLETQICQLSDRAVLQPMVAESSARSL